VRHDKVYDIHHNLEPCFFLEDHPNLVAEDAIISNCGRHAGGVIITENSREGMPLIKSGGDLQTPWPEGVNFRHLEEFGLLKFDILGLGTLRMFENCASRILQKQGNKTPSFKEIKDWFESKLHPDNNPMTDPKVYENVFWNGKWCGVFQFVSRNVQDFMQRMKPTSINDIAVATSIFRPGPLSLKVDQRFLSNRANPDEVVFKHPALREVYANTSGLLIFQEQLMLTYNKLCGVPLDETDSVRKAFTKKEIGNTEKAEVARAKLRESFKALSGAHSGLSEDVAGEIFDEMEKLVAYSFNASHAFSYAVASWQCAWFLTYYPDEWIATYIDYCAISKGKVTGKEDPKAIAIKEAKSLGYTLAKPDINASEYEIVNHPTIPRTLVPSFSSLKHVGKTAVSEIQQFRPYNSAKDLLINNDGTWRHSKFNKSALSALIKMEALETVGIVGEDKPFKNYRQVHAVLVDKYDTFKRIASRKKNNDVVAAMNEAIAEVQALEDWTKKEKLEFTKELAGSVDFDMIVSPETREKLDELGFECVDNWEEKGNYWAIVASAVIAQTKTGKNYLKLRLFGETNKEVACSIWGWRGAVNLTENDIIVGLFEKNSFGFSAFQNKIYKVN
jgi:DNA polymerase-3 subunit alpha